MIQSEIQTQCADSTATLQTKGSQSRRQIAVMAVLVVVALVLGGLGGWGLTAKARQDALAMQAQAQAQVRASQQQVNQLALQVSQVQAEMNRVNALGAQLVKNNKIRDSRFDFTKPVGQGGGDPDATTDGDMPAEQLQANLATLQANVKQGGQALGLLGSIVSKTTSIVKATLAVPLLNTYVTSAFGTRGDPIRGGRQFHKGIDFEADIGDSVMTVADGVVSYAGWRSGYGNTVEVEHANGYRTRYAHNSRLVAKVGQVVTAGTEIAKAGSTGRSTGPHVHLEVFKDSRLVNPLTFLNKKPTQS